MAEKSTFFNSVNGDRKYTAEDMAAHFAKMLTNGVMPAGTQLQVIEDSGMNVVVSAGSAWINGYAYHNDASFVLAIDPADGVLNRVDRIVVRWNKLARSINLTVLKGTPASSAVAPDIIRNADYYDLSIATINVNKGVTAITQALITDTRMDSDVCGFVSSLIQPDTSGWFVQFEAAFNEWFDSVKDTLGDNAAGQLQNQINQLKDDDNQIRALETKLPDNVATVLGLNPANNPRVKDGLLACTQWRSIKKYTVAGSYTFIVPDGVNSILVFIVGAGGSGGAYAYGDGAGGCAENGYPGKVSTTLIAVTAGQSIPVVVGAGGSSVVQSSGKYDNCNGIKGGTSSFNGVTAEGGARGLGSASGTYKDPRNIFSTICYGELPFAKLGAIVGESTKYSTGGTAAFGSSGEVRATRGKGIGAAGGGATSRGTYYSYDTISGAGSDGGILIYAVRGVSQ